jgi:hypothetical protein
VNSWCPAAAEQRRAAAPTGGGDGMLGAFPSDAGGGRWLSFTCARRFWSTMIEAGNTLCLRFTCARRSGPRNPEGGSAPGVPSPGAGLPAAAVLPAHLAAPLHPAPPPPARRLDRRSIYSTGAWGQPLRPPAAPGARAGNAFGGGGGVRVWRRPPAARWCWLQRFVCVCVVLVLPAAHTRTARAWLGRGRGSSRRRRSSTGG